LFADEEKQNEIAEKYRAGGYGYGHAKKELLGMIEEYFADARVKRKELVEDLDTVRDILREGGMKARARAEEVMEPVRKVTGLFKTYDFNSK
jgi:tryptophanyl-tRNA synthetase